jgi:uncharacterized protein (TIGR03437 family)
MKKILFMAVIVGAALAGCGKHEDPAVVISSFTPQQARHGETVTITGKNFSGNPANNSVTFNGMAATIISATPTLITATVPKNLQCSGKVRVTVAGKTTESATVFAYLPTAEVSLFAGKPNNHGDDDGHGLNYARFNSPAGVALDNDGNVYVAEQNNHRIRKITSAGMVSTLAGNTNGYLDATGTSARFNTPNGVAVGVSSGSVYVYVADYNNNRIRRITSAGVVITVAESFTEFDSPNDVAVDVSGNVYVSCFDNHRIYKINTSGTVSLLAGSTQGYREGTGAAAQFNNPNGVAVDAVGNVYVADLDNNRIRRITSDGKVTTLAGSGTYGNADGQGTAAQFSEPAGIAIDAAGNVYVADFSNHRIRRITPSGMVGTLAGSTYGYTNGTGTSAKFSYPHGIAVNAAGTLLYVGDMNNQVIRKITLE